MEERSRQSEPGERGQLLSPVMEASEQALDVRGRTIVPVNMCFPFPRGVKTLEGVLVQCEVISLIYYRQGKHILMPSVNSPEILSCIWIKSADERLVLMMKLEIRPLSHSLNWLWRS